jgi:hypothetical protein
VQISGGGVVNALDLNDFCRQLSNAFGRASSNLVLRVTFLAFWARFGFLVVFRLRCGFSSGVVGFRK